MSFFRQFPMTTYDLQKSGKPIRVVDLFRNVTAPQVKLDPTIAYTLYRVQNGERPDVVSQLLYGDPDYYWTPFIINDSLKAGLASWPMSNNQLDAYLTQEYDGYSVIQMMDLNTHYYNSSSGITYATTVAGIDFVANPQWIRNSKNDARLVMKYDPYMQQLWYYNSGSTDTFATQLAIDGGFQLSNSATTTSRTSLTINNLVYTNYFPGAALYGQGSILPYNLLGRNAIHHYTFLPQVGDVISFQGLSGTVTALIPAYVNANGGVVINGTQYVYFSDPQGFPITAQDVNQALIPNTTNPILPNSRIVPVTYSAYEQALNETRSQIRVVSPAYITAFAKQYQSLLNATSN